MHEWICRNYAYLSAILTFFLWEWASNGILLKNYWTFLPFLRTVVLVSDTFTFLTFESTARFFFNTPCTQHSMTEIEPHSFIHDDYMLLSSTVLCTIWLWQSVWTPNSPYKTVHPAEKVPHDIHLFVVEAQTWNKILFVHKWKNWVLCSAVFACLADWLGRCAPYPPHTHWLGVFSVYRQGAASPSRLGWWWNRGAGKTNLIQLFLWKQLETLRLLIYRRCSQMVVMWRWSVFFFVA